LGISGVSLHSYRYAWAERALKCGFPERFAQPALGHNSKAVHRAYAKHAEVTVPSLADWEKDWQENPQRSGQTISLTMNFSLPMVPPRRGGLN
jgi:integrase